MCFRSAPVGAYACPGSRRHGLRRRLHALASPVAPGEGPFPPLLSPWTSRRRRTRYRPRRPRNGRDGFAAQGKEAAASASGVALGAVTGAVLAWFLVPGDAGPPDRTPFEAVGAVPSSAPPPSPAPGRPGGRQPGLASTRLAVRTDTGPAPQSGTECRPGTSPGPSPRVRFPPRPWSVRSRTSPWTGATTGPRTCTAASARPATRPRSLAVCRGLRHRARAAERSNSRASDERHRRVGDGCGQSASALRARDGAVRCSPMPATMTAIS